MPIYDYRCSDCGKISEIMVGVSGHSETIQCKHCSSTSVSKMPTMASIATHYSRPHGKTCCGRDDRCDTPPCSTNSPCCEK